VKFCEYIVKAGLKLRCVRIGVSVLLLQLKIKPDAVSIDVNRVLLSGDAVSAAGFAFRADFIRGGQTVAVLNLDQELFNVPFSGSNNW